MSGSENQHNRLWRHNRPSSLVWIWLFLGVPLCRAPLLSQNTFDYKRIEKAIQERNLTWAEGQLEQRLREDAHDARAHMLLGIVCDERGQDVKAAEHFRIAVQLRPGDPAPHINLGKSLARRGEIDAATREFKTAIDLNPRDGNAYSNLGLLLMATKRNTDALKEFQKVVELAAQDPAGWLNLFQAELALKQFPEARRTSAKILEIVPPSPDIYARLGALQAEAGDLPAALENLKKAKSLAPDSYQANYNLGLAYYKAGDYARALGTLEPLARSRPVAEIENLLGEIYEKRENYLQAVRSFQKAAEMDPASEEYRFDFIYELLVHKNYDAALLVAQPAVVDFPSSLRLNLILGVTRFAKGLFDDAMQDFLRTSRKFPEIELPLYFLGIAGDAIKRNLPEALDLVRGYSNRHPDQFWPFYFLGHAAFQAARASHSLQDLQDAEGLLKKSIELNPGYADSYLDLGNVYFQRELWQQAVQEYQKAVSLQPALTEPHYKLYRAYLQVGDSTRAQREIEIHQRLQEREEQASARQRQVTIFLYELRD